jgi:hypothetical protein
LKQVEQLELGGAAERSGCAFFSYAFVLLPASLLTRLRRSCWRRGCRGNDCFFLIFVFFISGHLSLHICVEP